MRDPVLGFLVALLAIIAWWGAFALLAPDPEPPAKSVYIKLMPVGEEGQCLASHEGILAWEWNEVCKKPDHIGGDR